LLYKKKREEGRDNIEAFAHLAASLSSKKRAIAGEKKPPTIKPFTENKRNQKKQPRKEEFAKKCQALPNSRPSLPRRSRKRES
jgi:hypothetical protein